LRAALPAPSREENGAWRHRIDSDAVAPVLVAEGLHERDDARLGRGVVRGRVDAPDLPRRIADFASTEAIRLAVFFRSGLRFAMRSSAPQFCAKEGSFGRNISHSKPRVSHRARAPPPKATGERVRPIIELPDRALDARSRALGDATVPRQGVRDRRDAYPRVTGHVDDRRVAQPRVASRAG